MPLPVEQEIPLSPEQREDLAEELTRLIDDLEVEQAEDISDTGVWWQWYDATPDTPLRHEPWTGASNIVVPIGRTMVDSATARAMLTLFGTKSMWLGTTEDEEFFKPVLANVMRFVNDGAGDQLFNPLHDGINEDFAIGRGFWLQRWLNRERYLIPPNSTKPVRVLMGSGPVVDHIPRERILFPYDQDVRSAEIVVIQKPMTWSELSRNVQLMKWDAQAVEDSQSMVGLDGPGGDVLRQKRQVAGQQPHPSSDKLESHDIRTCLVDWPLFKSLSRKLQEVPGLNSQDQDATDISVRAIVTLHRKSRRILRAVYDPNTQLEGWPLYDARYRNGRSHGLMKILEHLQRGITTMVNQQIDAVTLANSLKLVTSNPEFARKRDLVPNQIPFISDINDIKELSGGKQIFPDIAAVNLLQAYAERVAGQSDPGFGREQRQGGHPSPATNFLGLLEQSQIIGSLPMKNVRRSLSQMGMDRALMFQRYEENKGEWIQRRYGQEDGDQISDWLESATVMADKVQVDVHALSEIHNPEGEMKKAVLINQMTTNYYVQAAKFLEAAANPQTPPAVKEVLQKGVSAAGETMKMFLEAAEVDEIEKFLLKMGEANDQSVEQLGQFAGLLGESAQGAAAGAEGPVPQRGVAAAPTGASALPFGANGGGGAGAV